MKNLNIAPTTTNFPPLLTVQEVAEYLRVDDTTVIRWVKKGILEACVLPSGVYRIRKQTLNKVLQPAN